MNYVFIVQAKRGLKSRGGKSNMGRRSLKNEFNVMETGCHVRPLRTTPVATVDVTFLAIKTLAIFLLPNPLFLIFQQEIHVMTGLTE